MSIPHAIACGASRTIAPSLVDILAQSPKTHESRLALAIATGQCCLPGPLLEWLLRHQSKPLAPFTPVNAYLLLKIVTSTEQVIQSTLTSLSLSGCAACWQKLRQRYLALDLPAFPSSCIVPSLCVMPAHTASSRERGVA